MPDLGGRELAASFTARIATVKARIATAQRGVAKALDDVDQQTSAFEEAEKQIVAEANSMRAAVNQLLGNAPPAATAATVAAPVGSTASAAKPAASNGAMPAPTLTEEQPFYTEKGPRVN